MSGDARATDVDAEAPAGARPAGAAVEVGGGSLGFDLSGAPLGAFDVRRGGYTAIDDAEYKKLQDDLYAQAVQAFEDSHRGQYGWIGELGEDRGMRGVFRKNLRMALYAD